ncbi:hypothetical protein [Solimonas marina]|uniref:Uncharacterized protein n=1 Tax=Solimonas marina TaxID=2714601 RepID=A0A970B401_9GAMM|nr:hypothetical protein [Solimonas marina]NKF21817.1 hypothetical protein [Solimonas marina]
MTSRRAWHGALLTLITAGTLSACKLSDLHVGASTPPLPAPPVCTVDLRTPAPILNLPLTDTPRGPAGGDDIDIAQIHTVNQPLADIGTWNDEPDGWSVLALTLGSRRARSLAVRMRDVKLPKQAQVWLCGTGGGKSRQGPYTNAPEHEIWTSPVNAPIARIEVWVPTAERPHFGATLTDVYGGYQ